MCTLRKDFFLSEAFVETKREEYRNLPQNAVLILAFLADLNDKHSVFVARGDRIEDNVVGKKRLAIERVLCSLGVIQIPLLHRFDGACARDGHAISVDPNVDIALLHPWTVHVKDEGIIGLTDVHHAKSRLRIFTVRIVSVRIEKALCRLKEGIEGGNAHAWLRFLLYGWRNVLSTYSCQKDPPFPMASVANHPESQCSEPILPSYSFPRLPSTVKKNEAGGSHGCVALNGVIPLDGSRRHPSQSVKQT